MNTTLAPTAEATCNCQHCSGHIAFDVHTFIPGQSVACPHCGLDTVLYIPQTQTQFAAQMTRAQARANRRRLQIIAIVAGVMLVPVVLVLIARQMGVGASTVGQLFGGGMGLVAGLLLGVLVLVWAILWITFPVFMYFAMQRQEKLLQRIEHNTRQ